jgi:hypothetical protein
MFRRIIALSVAGLVVLNATAGIGAPRISGAPAQTNDGSSSGKNNRKLQTSGNLRVKVVNHKGEAARGAAVKITWRGRHGGTYGSRVHRANGRGETVFTRFRQTMYFVHAHLGDERGAAMAAITGDRNEVVVRLHGHHYHQPQQSHSLGLLHHHHGASQNLANKVNGSNHSGAPPADKPQTGDKSF